MKAAQETPLWVPSSENMSASLLAKFIARQHESGWIRQPDYETLHQASVEDPAGFWSALWDFAGVVGDKGTAPWMTNGERLQDTQFFPTAKLNYAENLLQKTGDDPALIFCSENGDEDIVTWNGLRRDVARVAAYLESLNLEPGERVGAVLPNKPEAITAMLGASAVGGVWSSCSPDFGPNGIIDRLGQIEPKVLFAVDGYYYAGKTIDLRDRFAEVLQSLPSVKRVVIVPYIGTANDVADHLNALGARNYVASAWDDVIANQPETEISFKRLPFSHPLFVLFSSGTTGQPKCIVHTQGGMLLKHFSEHMLHSDIRPGDRLFYFTTLGWMMWNWLATALASRATLLLFDGSPFHPDGNCLWDFTSRHNCTHFGASAKYIDALKKAGLKPRESHDLSSLRAMFSTGSPLVPESFDYVYGDIKKDVHLASVSGGTDLCGCFVIGNPMQPVWRGEIQGAALGLDVDVTDPSGKSLPEGKGELVCRNAFPSMPAGFWNDPEGLRYHNAYFARMLGVWHHGDFSERAPHGGFFIHGRSDATLNPGGVRIGTAEIYRIVEQCPEINESIVIGQPYEGDVRVVLFVVMAKGMSLDEALEKKLRQMIRENASPRHVPAKIVAVSDIPRTRSGKITELAIRDVVMGQQVKNVEALANPEALKNFENLDALRS